MRFTAVAIALASAAVSFVAAEPIKAVAYLYAPPVSGLVYFSQESHDSPTRVYANLTGLTGGDHGIHIHEFGDLSQGCNSTGAHYNPFNQTHGGPDAEVRHVGDLGNIVADNTTGLAILNITSDLIQLSMAHSVIGRAVVVHSGKDDYGLGGTPLSNSTGNSGSRVACGVIGYASLVA